MAGVCPDPENSPDTIGVPVNPGGGLTPEREKAGSEMPLESGMAGEPRGPARADPISTSMGVSPCTATECIDWPEKAETPKRAERAETPGRAETPERAETPGGGGGGRDPREGRVKHWERLPSDIPGLALVTRKGRRAHAPGHLPRTFGPVTAPKNGSSLGSLSEFSLAEARLRAMDWVHGRSRVISGASRLHHVAGITQVTPGGPTNEWQGLRAQQPRTGLLASKWVFGKDLSTASTPVAMTGLVGFGTWGMGRREASLETGKYGGHFRPEGRKDARKDEKPDSKAANLNLLGDSALEVEGASGPLPSHICSPPWPNPLWAPSWTKRTYAKPAGVPTSSMRPERGRHSESREALYCTLSGHISDTQDADLIQRRRPDSCHTSCHVSC